MSGLFSKPPKVDNQVIKQGLALRAKYRKGQGEAPMIKLYPPALVVPHPQNRGGDPCVSLRTKELCNFVAKEGCDPMEASHGAVGVEDHPTKEHPRWRSFQEHFEKQVVGKDPDMAIKVNGITAAIGSLAHSHWTCLRRNVTEGEKLLLLFYTPW